MAGPTRVVILSGEGPHADPWHPLPETSARMAELLAPAHAVEIVTSVADLGTALKSAHVLLVNASANRTKPIPEDGEFGRRLDEFLTRGGGLLAMHSSAIAFPGLPGWRSAVGAAWDHGRTFHPPIGRSLIRRSTAVHPISEGLGDFWVHDERYSDLDLVSGIVPLYFHTDGSRTHPDMGASDRQGPHGLQRAGARPELLRLPGACGAADALRLLAQPRIRVAGGTGG